MNSFRSPSLLALAVLSAALVATAPAQAAPDPGKQACLIAKMAQVSPVCHGTMMTLKAQHDAGMPAKR